MPAFNPATKQRSIERLISALHAGKEISRRDLNTVLNAAQQQELDAAWRDQQALRAVRKPVTVAQYERLHKQALLMPGSRLPIRGSAALAEPSIGTCLLSLNPESEQKVRSKNQSFLDKGGEFLSVFALSPSSVYREIRR